MKRLPWSVVCDTNTWHDCVRGKVQLEQAFVDKLPVVPIFVLLELVGGVKACNFVRHRQAISFLAESRPGMLPSISDYRSHLKSPKSVPGMDEYIANAENELNTIYQMFMIADRYDQVSGHLMSGNEIVEIAPHSGIPKIDDMRVIPYYRGLRDKVHEERAKVVMETFAHAYTLAGGDPAEVDEYLRGDTEKKPRNRRLLELFKSREFLERLTQANAQDHGGSEVDFEMASCCSAVLREFFVEILGQGRKPQGNDYIDLAYTYYLVNDEHLLQTSDKALRRRIVNAGFGHRLNHY